MALSTTLILDGKVTRQSLREGVSARTGRDYSIRTAVIVGDLCMGQVTVPDDIVLVDNESYALLVEVSTFNDDDQLRAVKVLRGPAAPKAA